LTTISTTAASPGYRNIHGNHRSQIPQKTTRTVKCLLRIRDIDSDRTTSLRMDFGISEIFLRSYCADRITARRAEPYRASMFPSPNRRAPLPRVSFSSCFRLPRRAAPLCRALLPDNSSSRVPWRGGSALQRAFSPSRRRARNRESQLNGIHRRLLGTSQVPARHARRQSENALFGAAWSRGR
jgi:hypothetical protein